MLQKILIILQMGGFLLFLMYGNVSLGKKIADLKAEYNRATFLNGLSKFGNIGFFIIGLYIFGQLPLFQTLTFLNPLGDGTITIDSFVTGLMWASIIYYLGLDGAKLYTLIKTSTAAKETEEVTEEITIDTSIDTLDADTPITPTEEEIKQTEAGA